MNGRVNKVAMLGKVMRMKDGLHRHQWYPHWNDDERAAAQMILNNVLDVLDMFYKCSNLKTCVHNIYFFKPT